MGSISSCINISIFDIGTQTGGEFMKAFKDNLEKEARKNARK